MPLSTHAASVIPFPLLRGPRVVSTRVSWPRETNLTAAVPILPLPPIAKSIPTRMPRQEFDNTRGIPSGTTLRRTLSNGCGCLKLFYRRFWTVKIERTIVWNNIERNQSVFQPKRFHNFSNEQKFYVRRSNVLFYGHILTSSSSGWPIVTCLKYFHADLAYLKIESIYSEYELLSFKWNIIWSKLYCSLVTRIASIILTRRDYNLFVWICISEKD